VRTGGVRAATTAATRQAVIDAGRQLLAAGEWRGFTLDAVAATAGVTRVTVYNQVRSKAGLLDAILTDLTERAGMDQLLTATKQMPAADALTYVVDRTCRFWHTERSVLRPLFGLSAVDKDIAANLGQRERWRTDQLDRLIDRLDHEGALTAGLPKSQVLAGLVAVTAFATYDALGVVADEPARAAALIGVLVTSLTGEAPRPG
jgi:AcrR family transcriptional regulator